MPQDPNGSMLSDAAIAAMQVRADDELRQRIAFIRQQAQIEAIQLAVAPYFIGNLVPDGSKSVMPKGPDPRLAAEKLLRSVLPEDLCISLSAINECEVQGKKHRYKIFKDQKTHCIQGDRTFSCCIGLSDTSAPDTDRIIAEYLLITNYEEAYLRTANLTEITRPREALSGAALNAIWRDEAVGDHTADAIRYANRYANRWIRMILNQIARLISNALQRRFPILAPHEMADPRYNREILSVRGESHLEIRFDELSERFLQQIAAEMAHQINERPSIFAFFDLPVGPIESGRIVSEDGIKLSVTRAYDPTRTAEYHV